LWPASRENVSVSDTPSTPTPPQAADSGPPEDPSIPLRWTPVQSWSAGVPSVASSFPVPVAVPPQEPGLLHPTFEPPVVGPPPGSPAITSAPAATRPSGARPDAEPSMLISSVPGVPSRGEGAVSRRGPSVPTFAAPPVDQIPIALSSPGGSTSRVEQGESPLAQDVADDVETTRLAQERLARDHAAASVPSSVVLQLWDGRRLTLTGPALVGRSPVSRPGELAPVHTLVVEDSGLSVSKTHLAIGLAASGVWVRDRGSTNGTFVVMPDGSRFRCSPEHEVHVPIGGTVAFGSYWFTVG
jgi:hypothetical protein